MAADDNENPTVFVLKRELSEVHLLLDNLSTNPAKSLAKANEDLPEGVDKDWIELICQMNWPPGDVTAQQRGKDAALLIRAKDYLNTVTSPASGASIAFTLLVTQDEDDHGWSPLAAILRGLGLSRGRSRSAGNPNPGGQGAASPPPPGGGSGGGGGAGGGSGGPTRRSLAEDAYPGLIHSALKYRRWVVVFAWVLAIILVLTSVASVYAAYGNISLAARATAQVKLDDATKRVSDLEGGPKSGADTGQATDQAKPTAPTKAEHLCPPDGKLPYPTPSAMQACEAKAAAQRRVEANDGILGGWLMWPLFFHIKTQGEDTQLVAVTVVTVLGTTVLPVLYGILGAATAVVRLLSFKIRTSQLTPRDIQLLYQQLLLGTVTGACISLFVAQPTADHATTPGLIGTVALSAAALSFIAGFGVDQVFAALEALIKRVFLVGDTPPPAK